MMKHNYAELSSVVTEHDGADDLSYFSSNVLLHRPWFHEHRRYVQIHSFFSDFFRCGHASLREALSVSLLVHRSVGPSVRRSIGLLVRRSVGLLVRW